MAEWCQNKDCAKKKTQSQIRGTKGSKYYQSNKAHSYYYDMFCGQRCFHNWFAKHHETCLNTVGEIGKQTLPCDNAWYVTHEWGYNNEIHQSYVRYFIKNKLQGIKQTITKEQAQTPEQRQRDQEWFTIDDEQAKELAVTLGLSR